VATVEHAAPHAAVATELLYRRHAQRVGRYCLCFLRRHADAEDALQQTFLQAHRALVRGIEPASETAWLLAIARNVCLTRADASSRRGRAEVAQDPLALDDLAVAEQPDEGISAEVRAALGRLPLRQRQALFLREWHEWPYSEIAAALGTSEAAVEALLVRARRSLADELGARRRRAADLVWLLGWLRHSTGSAGAKAALGAAVTAAAVGTGVAVQGHHGSAAPPAGTLVPAAVASRPPRTIAAAERPASQPAAPPTHVRVRAVRARRAPAPAPVAAPNVSAPAAQAAPPATPSRPAPARPPAPPRAPVTPGRATPQPPGSPTETVASVLQDATNAVEDTTSTVSSTAAAAAQTAAAAAPAAAPAATAAAQAVDTASGTVDDALDSTTATLTSLLGGH
jgi:RNA polymerase sigma-70 factor (ECF subfamily)